MFHFLLIYVLFGFVTGWEEHLRNDNLSVERHVKP